MKNEDFQKKLEELNKYLLVLDNDIDGFIEEIQQLFLKSVRKNQDSLRLSLLLSILKERKELIKKDKLELQKI